ncbi:MAG: HIT family protein [Methylophilaceae bacterium]|nr:HIT family protein [Methylophilaceae bacterium]
MTKSINQCIFCGLENDNIFLQNELAFARFDKFPVSEGHILIIPFRHVSNYFELSEKEKSACFELVDLVKQQIDILYKPDGYNVGININEVAGQTIWHAHIHLIPRYSNDVPNPKGGVRGVIPNKQSY